MAVHAKNRQVSLAGESRSNFFGLRSGARRQHDSYTLQHKADDVASGSPAAVNAIETMRVGQSGLTARGSVCAWPGFDVRREAAHVEPT